jgi:integrase
MTRSRANGEGSIFPYRNGYAAYAWVTTPAGRARRKYVYGKTREIVHDKWIKLHQRAKQGPVATSAPTLGVYMNSWLDDVIKPNVAPLTYQTYEALTRLHIIPEIGHHRLDRLRVVDVQRFLNRVQTACQCCRQGKDERRPQDKRRCCAIGQCCAQTLGRRSIKDIRTVLRSALSSAVTDEIISRNVASHVKLPSGRSRKGRRWTTDEARIFLETATDRDYALCVVFVLILVLGLRKGEVLGLHWSDVDLDQGEVTIAWQLQRVGGQLILRETKTEASDATMPLPDICIAGLKRRHAAQQTDQAAAGRAWHNADLVFTTKYGLPIEPRNLNRAFAACIKQAGVPYITVHDARRTCASLLAELGVHPRVIMQILRHADMAVTMEIYTEVVSAQTRDALKRLGDALAEKAG